VGPFLSRDSLNEPKYFIYEETPVEFITVSLYDPVNIGRNRKEVETVLQGGCRVINSSLWNAAVSSDLSPVVAILLSEVFAWNIDFFGLQKGDTFRAIYEEDFVEDFCRKPQDKGGMVQPYGKGFLRNTLRTGQCTAFL
jgi:hypothetical protein